MRLWSYLLISLFSISYIAVADQKIATHIFALEGANGNLNIDVLASFNGRVYEAPTSNTGLVETLKLAHLGKKAVVLTVDSDGSTVLEADIPSNNAEGYNYLTWTAERNRESRIKTERRLETFRPTVLDSLQEAERLFTSVFSYEDADLNDNCFNRAHFWARNFELKFKVKSQKIFVMFTSKYRRTHNYKWWYHVAPFVLVGGRAVSNQYVLDPSFRDEPEDSQTWSLAFADQAKKCVPGKNIQDYYARGEKEDCINLRANMYHLSPNDVDGTNSISGWRCSDLKGVMRALPAPGGNWNTVKGFLPADCR